MKVRLTRQAETDLVEIGFFVAGDSPLAAHRLVARLRARCRGLGRFPERCLVAFWTDPPVRRATEGSYSVLYTIDAEVVLVRRILHGAREVDPSMIGLA